MNSATMVVAASSVMLPLVTAHTVASERGVGGRIFMKTSAQAQVASFWTRKEMKNLG